MMVEIYCVTPAEYTERYIYLHDTHHTVSVLARCDLQADFVMVAGLLHMFSLF